VVSNPGKTKLIAAATVKTDAVDAKTLANLLRSDYLPAVWQPDPDTESLRELVSFRSQLTNTRTRYTNRIRSILQQLMIELPSRRMDTRAARAALDAAQLPPQERLQVDTLLRLIDETQSSIDQVDQELARIAEGTPQIKLLLTLPGMGVQAACALSAAIGEISRFKSSNHLVGYLGLAPQVKQSGSHTWYGSITKTGSKQARRLMVLAAHHVKRHPGPLGDFYRRLTQRKHGSVAAVATARKMVEVAYHMLTNNEPYRYADPERTQRKLDQLHYRATGNARPPMKRNVPAENEPKKPNGDNYRRDAVPALNDVYARCGLPQIAWNNLSDDESAATQAVSDYVSSLRAAYAQYRKVSKKSASAP
jgi:transposase